MTETCLQSMLSSLLEHDPEHGVKTLHMSDELHRMRFHAASKCKRKTFRFSTNAYQRKCHLFFIIHSETNENALRK